jgi:FtsP/CotA-like multicopper oxidase with cupredoxin domain
MIITGQPHTNVRVHVPGVVVQANGTGTGVNPIVPIAPGNGEKYYVPFNNPPKIRPISFTFFPVVS